MTKEQFREKAQAVLETKKESIIRWLGRNMLFNTFRNANPKVMERYQWMAENVGYSLENINTPDVIVYQTIINCIDQTGIKPFKPEELMELKKYCYEKRK